MKIVKRTKPFIFLILKKGTIKSEFNAKNLNSVNLNNFEGLFCCGIILTAIVSLGSIVITNYLPDILSLSCGMICSSVSSSRQLSSLITRANDYDD